MSSPTTIHQLRDGLTDYGAAETELALENLCHRIGGIVGADNGLWFGAVRMLRGAPAQKGPAYGWRSPVIQAWKPDLKVVELARLFRESLESKNEACIGATTRLAR